MRISRPWHIAFQWRVWRSNFPWQWQSTCKNHNTGTCTFKNGAQTWTTILNMIYGSINKQQIPIKTVLCYTKSKVTQHIHCRHQLTIISQEQRSRGQVAVFFKYCFVGIKPYIKTLYCRLSLHSSFDWWCRKIVWLIFAFWKTVGLESNSNSFNSILILLLAACCFQEVQLFLCLTSTSLLIWILKLLSRNACKWK